MLQAKYGLLALLALGVGLARAQAGIDVAMVVFLRGGVSRVTAQGPQPMQSFVKLKHGDLLALQRDARLQVVYFEGGRQETWQGGGRLEVTKVESRAYGLPPPEAKVLPAVMVRQIARTPALDSQGRAGMMRLRSVPTAEDIARVESTYKRLRMEADRDDLNPELYLLSGLFEMRELDRVEQVLGDLQRARPGSQEVGLLVALYQKALKNAREAKGN
ncbi:MAG: hypothetical protein OHM77_09460 [Candidatus Nitricoxidivorans perseverans]|uniref:Uncharacterized protein n=1 Tax=Candidatus Nitricoxidivorans perseverans TaxID=2975601 RepID=A0AA49FK07_9PROT|nr:MAG: hypothetical protein OHM77_09460 [Candidatus Nitricoxidivorans perseverans]